MRTIWWESGMVKMIDQRLLPGRLEIVAYDDYRDVARAITDMVIRGAPAIGAAGAYGMALAARQSSAQDRDGLLRDLRQAKEVLDAARPTAVNLSWATTRLLKVAERPDLTDVEAIRSALLAEAERVAEEDIAINKRMGAYGAEVIPHGARILHHCNTGSLATVDYGTALGVIRAAHEQGKQIHVWVDETRPRLQGARLTAWELMRDGIPMTLIADNAAGHLMRTGQVDVVLFGADRVAANGDVANKIGTYKLAVCAKENGIPCYAVVPTSTIDLSLPDGDHIPIEERVPEEVTMIDGVRIAPEGVRVYNPAFDITPYRYLTGIITEEGIAYPPFRESLRRLKEAAEARIWSDR
ncbi:MAG TPA: S-methyl-5-thioribose-1-phosphate isomerase [Caldilineae bacterium]|nr:S-methyl-5-thioribose-1-phosphate isomerase [Caldilineae bacterium]